MEKKKTMFVEQSFTDHESGDINQNFDDDGREKRTGYSVLFSVHLIYIMIIHTK